MRNVYRFFKLEIDHKRIFGLDLLRFFAIIFVLIMHSLHFLPKKIQEILTIMNYDGVSIFFVLSGFLIGNILIKTFDNNHFTIKKLYNFWIKRWLRTLPNYYLILLFYIIVFVLILNKFSLKTAIPYFIFFSFKI